MKILLLVLLFIWLIHLSIYAQEDKNAHGPGEGMEIRRIEGHNLLVPKDARVWKEGGVLKVEDATQYSVSRFNKIEKHLEEIDTKLIKLQNQIDELKKMLK